MRGTVEGENSDHEKGAAIAPDRSHLGGGGFSARMNAHDGGSRASPIIPASLPCKFPVMIAYCESRGGLTFSAASALRRFDTLGWSSGTFSFCSSW
jgi:hypothetical protein